MNTLDAATRVRIVSCLVEGNSIRATCRMTGAAKGTVLKLLADLGGACREYHDAKVRGLKCQRVQCDEIWSFCGAKDKNVLPDEQEASGAARSGRGPRSTPIRSSSPSYHVGTRDAGCAYEFMTDLAERIATRVQLTTDGHKAYINAVADAFGPANIDYAMLVKLFGETPAGPGRYSPPACIGIEMRPIMGDPDDGARVDLVRRAPEPHDAHVDAPLHAADERVLKEVREPRARGRAALHALQLLPRAPDAPRDAGDGRGAHGSRVGTRRSSSRSCRSRSRKRGGA